MKLGKPSKNNAGLYKSGNRNQEKGKACRDKLQAFFYSKDALISTPKRHNRLSQVNIRYFIVFPFFITSICMRENSIRLDLNTKNVKIYLV